MPVRLVVLSGCVLMALGGCDKDKTGAVEPAHTHVEPVKADEHAPAHAPAQAEPNELVTFSLDDGKKWSLDESTRAAVARLDKRLEAGAADETAAAYHALGRAMATELTTLVKGCNMQGPAHDQLHVFLGAVFPRVSTLQKAEALPELKAAAAELSAVFARYHDAFE